MKMKAHEFFDKHRIAEHHAAWPQITRLVPTGSGTRIRAPTARTVTSCGELSTEYERWCSARDGSERSIHASRAHHALLLSGVCLRRSDPLGLRLDSSSRHPRRGCSRFDDERQRSFDPRRHERRDGTRTPLARPQAGFEFHLAVRDVEMELEPRLRVRYARRAG